MTYKGCRKIRQDFEKKFFSGDDGKGQECGKILVECNKFFYKLKKEKSVLSKFFTHK